MDTNTERFQINPYRLEKEIHLKAKEYLDDISEDNLKNFAEATKYIAMSVLEEYYYSIDDFYSDGEFKITDYELYEHFIDFHKGYRSQMKEWISNNGITIKKVTLSPDIKMPQFDDDNNSTIPLTIIGTGTIVVVCLAIFSEIWIAVAASLLLLGTAAYAYKKSKSTKNEEYEFKMRQYEIKIEQEKAKLVNGLISDLKQWLKLAEQNSKKILMSFNLK